ncbi:HNH endonuclease family, partial [human gut metagenome]
LGIMYWVDLGNGQYEVLDGQQRILAICNYVMGNYSVKSNKFPSSAPQQDFPNLQMNLTDLAVQILDYELDIYVCEAHLIAVCRYSCLFQLPFNSGSALSLFGFSSASTTPRPLFVENLCLAL